jgi:hypothetical protein
MSMFNKILFFGFVLTFSSIHAAEDTTLVNREQRLVLLLDDVRKAENDAEKNRTNKLLNSYLFETLQLPGAYSYPFSKLKSIGFIDSPDGLIRIVNWNVEQDDNTHRYFGYILRMDEKKKNVQVIEMVDNSFMLPPQPTEILDANNWYGALYYKIIPFDKGSKTMYTLLGWDGATSASNFKLIDVLYFNGNQAKFGSPIFKMKNTTLKRVFFEHSEKATMSLRYEDQYKRIIFDHLSPESPGLEGFYSFYVPDLSLDAFMIEGNKWVLREDVIGINDPSGKNITVYAIDEKTGRVEEKQIKNKWIDPEGQKGPAGGIEHRAVMPEDEMNPDATKKKKTKEKKNTVKDKRDPSQMNSTLGKTKKKKKKH